MNVLIVEDQEENRYLLRSLLTGSGHQVTEAANGKVALEILAEGTWDLVISDILMPVMDGYQLCREIRSDERLKHVPFIFYTATYVDQKDEDFALKLGADRFYRKPIDPRLFLENVREFMEEIAKDPGRVRPAVQASEKEILKLYNERLVNKLEKKMLSLEKEVAERKRTEEALLASLKVKEALLREIHHRVKNNMQVIASLLNLQVRLTKNEECRKVLIDGQTRIRSMSLVHEYLYRSPDLSKVDLTGYIRNISNYLSSVFLDDPRRVRVEMELEEVLVDINSAVPCGILLNELIANALKHAFPGGRTGVVRIGLRRQPSGVLEIRVADDGVGLPEGLDFRGAETMGLQIMNLLVGQLDAVLEIDRTKGTAVTVMFRELNYGPRT
jgi:two-component sensor histidine kinase/FixJ family two-component response regulator